MQSHRCNLARRKRPEAFSKLDLQIHSRLHARASWIAEYAPRSKRTRTEFHSSIEPPDDVLVGKELR